MASSRPLLVLHDEEEGHLVYDLLVLGSEEDPHPDETRTVSCLPHPVACFPARLGCRAFAVSGGSVLGAFYDFWDDTLFHDTVMLVGGYDFWEKQPSPRMRDSEGRLVQWWPLGRGFDVMPPQTDGAYNGAPAMLPMGDGTVIRMDRVLFDGMYSFETLRRLPGAGGGWHATALPKPPVGQLAEEELAFVSAYVAVGTRVWISVARKGTFSLDTRAGTWTTEGTWQLPFEGRALHVPELGAVVGLTAGDGDGGGILCACDVVETGTGTPPVMRRLWRETLPRPWEERIAGDGRRSPDSRPGDMPSLAHLGKGTFCICRPMTTSTGEHDGPPIMYDACSFLMVEVGRLPSGELELIKRGRTSYMCPPRGREWAYVGFIQPAT